MSEQDNFPDATGDDLVAMIHHRDKRIRELEADKQHYKEKCEELIEGLKTAAPPEDDSGGGWDIDVQLLISIRDEITTEEDGAPSLETIDAVLNAWRKRIALSRNEAQAKGGAHGE